MKLQNKGGLFMRMKDGKVRYIIYIKTNFLPKTKALKHHKILYYDREAGELKERSHESNKIWGVVFDNGSDYVMTEDMSYADFNEMVEEASEVYNVNHYTADKLYEAMKALGLKKIYTKKWFADKHAFILKQLEEMS
jgi:hypothetical protein